MLENTWDMVPIREYNRRNSLLMVQLAVLMGSVNGHGQLRFQGVMATVPHPQTSTRAGDAESRAIAHPKDCTMSK